MQTFAYDGTFEGLLCCVFEAYARKTFPHALLCPEREAGLLPGARLEIAACPERAERVYQGLKRRLSPRGLRNLTCGWLSAEPGADMLLFRYMRKVFDSRGDIGGDLADPDVLALTKLARQVTWEQHKLTGFVRFQKSAQGPYFAAIRPRHNVLPLLLEHFAARFSPQTWILYDLGRRYGVLHEQGYLREIVLPQALADELDKNRGRLPEKELEEEEKIIQELWRGYFQAVSIEERRNPKLQRQLMPRRYWECLTEKQASSSGNVP